MLNIPQSLVYKILVLVRALTFWRFWDWSYKIGLLPGNHALKWYLGADLTYLMYFIDLPQLCTQISQQSHNFAL